MSILEAQCGLDRLQVAYYEARQRMRFTAAPRIFSEVAGTKDRALHSHTLRCARE